MRTRAYPLVFPLLLSLSNAWATPPEESGSTALTIFAAGSLRGVLQEVERQYTAHYGITFKTVYGPSGVLAKRIESGEVPDLFLSADFDHPQRLAADGKSLSPVVFARNVQCPGQNVGPFSKARHLHPKIRSQRRLHLGDVFPCRRNSSRCVLGAERKGPSTSRWSAEPRRAAGSECCPIFLRSA
jgi:hypothetical protein